MNINNLGLGIGSDGLCHLRNRLQTAAAADGTEAARGCAVD
jgi:hypothetical protein